MKLKIGEKIGYAFGDLSNTGGCLFVGTFLLTFLTICVGLSGTVAGAVIMAATIFDAINDVIIGSIVDKLHGKGVKYTRVMRASVLPLAVLIILLFISPNFSVGLKIVYALLVYSVYTIFITLYQVPYGALSSAMTEDTDTRISLGAFRDWGANLGSFLVNTFGSVLILHFGGGAMTYRGFVIAAAILAVIVIAGGIVPVLCCKERVPITATQEAPLKDGLKAFFSNRAAIVSTLVLSLVDFGMFARAEFTTYYATYCLGNANWISPILSVMSLVPLIAIFFVPVVTRKVDRKPLFCCAGIFMATAGLIESVSTTLVGSMISSVLLGMSLCCSITVTWGAIPDIADYGEFKTGIFAPGVIYSMMTFVMKVAEALASMSLGLILDNYDFNADVITQTAITGIRLWYGLIPIVLGIIALIVALFFNLSRKRIDDIHEILNQRHNEHGDLRSISE